MKKFIIITIIIILLIGIGTLIINIHMINSTKKQIININDLEKTDDYDAIIVLGCKVNGDSPSMMLANRLDKAIEVYQKMPTKILLTGDHGKKKYDEVNVMRDYMLTSEINIDDIFLDHAGFNTYDSIYRAKYIFEAKKVLIITQEYHMYRALYIANELGLEAKGINANDVPYKGIMLKNEIREVLSRDKNYFKVLIKPKSTYLGDVIPLNQSGLVTNG